MSDVRSRAAQSARNVGVSIAAQIVVILLGFVTRTVFISQLGVDLLGVNTVLTSVVALLAFADLGINGALMFALYTPLRNGDTRSTAAIVRYAGKLFRWVAGAVALCGLALTPFIDQLVRSAGAVPHLQIYFLILLVDTVAGYLMLDRLVLLNADQKIYVTKAYSLVFTVLRSAAQIIALLAFQSFLVFLVIQVLSTVANNVVVYLRAGKIYPFLSAPGEPLPDGERREIIRSTRAMIVYRIGGLVLNNSTPLLISLIVGTVSLGYYSNYLLIVGSAVMVLEVAFAALTPSVGNLVAGGSADLARRAFDDMVLLAILVHGLVAIGLVLLMDDFVTLWLGTDFVLSGWVVLAISMNFYVTGTLMPLWSFRSATGLFRQARFVILLTTAVSVALSFALGPTLGLAGIVAAPALARLLTVAWYEPWLLIRRYLSGRSWPYFTLQAGALVLWCAVALVVDLVGDQWSGGVLTGMFLEIGLLAVVFPLAAWLAFGRTAASRSLLGRARHVARRLSKGRV